MFYNSKVCSMRQVFLFPKTTSIFHEDCAFCFFTEAKYDFHLF